MYITLEFTNGVPNNYHYDMEFYVNGKKWKLLYHALYDYAIMQYKIISNV